MELLTNFPAVIDNTMRTAGDACWRKFQLAHIHNLRKSDPSIHLTAGGAFAAGLEVLRKEYYGGNKAMHSCLARAYIAAIKHWDESLDDPLLDEAKSLPNVLCAIRYYAYEFPLSTDWIQPLRGENDEPLIEFTFALPLPYNNPQTGDPILYCGRFDMFADYGGEPAVYDDKTATQLGAQWVNGWALDSQMSGYIYAARQHGYDTHTAIIRGVSFLKKSFGNAQAIEHRTDFELNDWALTLEHNVQQMLHYWQKLGPLEPWPKSLGQACKAYGGCPYVSLCRKENWKEWIEPDFGVFVWNPLDLTVEKNG